MLNKIMTIVCLLSLLSLKGCWFETEHTQLICIADVTASIDPTAQTEAMTAWQAAFRQLKRGDSMVIIPVTADATTQAAGRVLRFQLSSKRAAYDADLKKLTNEVTQKLQALRDEAVAHPYQHSDILGALQQAAEEMAQGKGNARTVVVVLSDLVHDTPTLHFRSEARLQNDAVAAQLAADLAQRNNAKLRGARVFLGLLRSKDWQGLSETRRAALRTFWAEYCKRSEAGEIAPVTDGPGLLAPFLARVKETK